MTFLEPPKISLYGKKVLCIDDEIYHDEIDRQNFTFRTGLYYEDLLFTDSYDSALEMLEKYPEISIVIADLRIPKNSENFYDYNPDNPDKEWGYVLIDEILKRYSNRRKIRIIVISAYTIYSCTNEDPSAPILAFHPKPLNYNMLIENLETVVNRDLIQTFDYASLSLETSEFVWERTQQIKKRIERIEEDIIAIGKYLIEVKEKLPVGQYIKWLQAEFNWSDRQSRRYVSVAKRFGGRLDTLSKLNIDRTAYYDLAKTTTSEEVVEAVLERAQTGERITPKIVKEVQQKYLNPEPDSTQQSATQETREKAVKNRKRSILSPLSSSKPKKSELLRQAVLKIVPGQKAVKNSWWQLGKDHKLFCGEPTSQKFLEGLPQEIALTINLPPNNDSSLIPSINSDSNFTYHSKYKDLDPIFMEQMLEKCGLISTGYGELIVFSYVLDVSLLDVAVKLGCHFYVAEPDLDKCEQILAIWRQKESVERIRV